MSDKPIIFNPLDKKNLGASVANSLLSQSVHPLGRLKDFTGAGVYAIYYTGKFPAYAAIASLNLRDKFDTPIYVGKAVSAGSRKGGHLESESSKVLYRRLCEHAESLRSVENLDIDDFYCRYLVVEEIWIPLGESLLISRFTPIWNNLIDGFGNHDPGGGRYQGMRPRWDVIHPGRKWALNCKERLETVESITNEIKAFL